MWALWLTAALAVPPLAPDAIVGVQPVHLATPWRYTWSAEPRDVRDTTLIAVRVDPEVARPRQTATPVLYLDREPVEILRQSADLRCLVALAPRKGVTGAALFWGPDTLPEEVDAAAGAAALAAAQREGSAQMIRMTPQPTAAVPTIQALRDRADALLRACR